MDGRRRLGAEGPHGHVRETANKYFQGKESVPVALARRRIKSGGDVKAALSLMPITKPVFARYRSMLEAEYPHLLV